MKKYDKQTELEIIAMCCIIVALIFASLLIYKFA